MPQPPTKADLGEAIRLLALTDEGRTLLRVLIRPALEQLPTDAGEGLAAIGRHNEAVRWLNSVVTHCPGSLLALLVEEDGQDHGGRRGHDRGRDASTGRAAAGWRDEGPAAHHRSDDRPADPGD